MQRVGIVLLKSAVLIKKYIHHDISCQITLFFFCVLTSLALYKKDVIIFMTKHDLCRSKNENLSRKRNKNNVGKNECVCACHKLAFISSSCKCQKQVVFVVKRYTVHKAKIRQYAVGGLKSNTQNARERGTSLSHVIVQMSMLQFIELELNQLSRSR